MNQPNQSTAGRSEHADQSAAEVSAAALTEPQALPVENEERAGSAGHIASAGTTASVETAPYDVIVVGGGAAGMMAAGTAASLGKSVLLLEKNARPGRKLLITGKGRCNVTNHCGRDAFLAHIPQNPRFLYSALAQFSPEDTIAFFENLGVPLKTERGNRVFPVSDQAADIADALVSYAVPADRVEETAEALLFRDGQLCGVKCASGAKFTAPSVILATGGLSYPRTGSTGDGYRLARQVGHTVTPLRPSLVPIEVEELPVCRNLQGLSLRNVALTIRAEGETVFREQGELLFTHFGLSGPLILSGSAHMRAMGEKTYTLHIDCKPGLSDEQLDRRLCRDFAENPNRDFGNLLGGLVPRKLCGTVLSRCGIPREQKAHQITREQRRALFETLRDLTFTAARFRPIEEAIITSGGVEVSEVSPKTMESKRCPGLYFAGELLDVDGYTGGFNLQIAFSTGYLAGMNSSQR